MLVLRNLADADDADSIGFPAGLPLRSPEIARSALFGQGAAQPNGAFPRASKSAAHALASDYCAWSNADDNLAPGRWPKEALPMNAQSEMLNALASRRHGHTLPRKFYSDPAFYQADLDNLYYREWLFVGHDCELAEPGAYFTLQVGDYPIIVVRGRDGAIRAFNNSCRHRGSRICSAERGSAVRLVCPYHNWSYNLDGRLLFARDMGKGFDPKPLGLKPVHCESVAGYLWLCLAPAPPDFAAFRAKVAPYLAPHRLSEAKIAHQSTIVENGNWKLVWENNRECYHCAPNHPELCRTFPEAPTVSGVEGAMSDPFITDHW